MIHKLFDLIEDRKSNPLPGSYTNALLGAGYESTAKKLGEEAIEVIIAAGHQSRQRLIEETSDLMYHLFVLLVQRGISLAEIEKELEDRHTKRETDGNSSI